MSDETAPSQQRPFLSAAEPSRYFPAGAIEDARRRIVRCVSRREGTALLIGVAGSGKTLLLEVLAGEFADQMAVVRLLGAQLCTRRAMLQMILFELGLPFRDMDEGELRLALQEHLRPADAPARQLLLLVDEADALPIRLLEELRALTHAAEEGAPLVGIVLAGNHSLEESFAAPRLDLFAQRLAARCYLSPLTHDETLQFIRSQLAAVAADADQLFAADGLDAVHTATDGVPRLVNQLCDQLMWMIEETGCQPLDATLVQQAWSDLQQLPAPWDTDAGAAASSSVIEFGELDDEADAYATVEILVDAVDHAHPIEVLGDDLPDDESILEERPGESLDMPASISIEAARNRRDAATTEDIAEAMDAAED
ncbi:MAG: AAA family ATPase, partial [Planctomycetota bacterium]